MASSRFWSIRSVRSVAFIASVAASGVCLPPSATRAAQPYGNSLDWAPASASIYSTSLRLKEHFDVIAASNAWKTFREIPTVAQGWALAEAQLNDPDGPAAIFWQAMELPENKQMVQVFGEMFSDEVVFYAGEDFVKLIELFQVVNGSRIAPMLDALSQVQAASGGALGGPGVIVQADPSQARLQVVLDAIEEDPDLLNVPELVFAFRIKDKPAATTQLARLEVVANMLLDQTGLGAKFERREFNDTEFLVLFLEGSMISLPEEMPYGLNMDEDSYQKLRQIIGQKQLYVSLGLWNDYVVLSLNNSTEHLASFGTGAPMSGRAEFAVLEKHRDRKLAAASYASKEVVASQLIQSSDLDDIATELNDFLATLPDMPAELRARISADLQEGAADFSIYLPVAGPAAGFSFMTDSGFEGYSYSWTKQPTLEGSKPLELAQHVGGSPVIAFVARGVDDPEGYDLLVKWIGKVYTYVEDYAIEQMEEEEREEFEKAMEIAKPLLARFDAVTREKLAPALADGQSAIVLDADIASKQWQTEMPASFEPLPMAELAIVVGVTDSNKLVDAMSDYREIINEAIDAVRKENPDEVPEGVQFPAPEAIEASGGTLYAWKLNAELGLDEQVVPCAAVGDRMAAIASSRNLAERALAAQPLAGAVDALGDRAEPRAMLVAFNWADLVTAVEPWVCYAIRQNLAGEGAAAQDPSKNPAEVEAICSQVKTGLSILKCFRGVWAETQREGDAWVTHAVLVVKDLED